MIEYNSNYVKFEPIDPDTPEGAAEIQHFLARAIEFRMHPPKKRGRMAIPCDKDGIFGKPIFYDYVMVACDAPTPHIRNFCKKFCELYLKTDDGANIIKFVPHAEFLQKDDYRAVIWVKGNDEMPFNVKNMFYGKSKNDKPVFIFGPAMIESCKAKDLDSPYVRVRMKKVYMASTTEE